MNKSIFFGLSALVLVLCCTGYLLAEESDEATASSYADANHLEGSIYPVLNNNEGSVQFVSSNGTSITAFSYKCIQQVSKWTLVINNSTSFQVQVIGGGNPKLCWEWSAEEYPHIIIWEETSSHDKHTFSLSNTSGLAGGVQSVSVSNSVNAQISITNVDYPSITISQTGNVSNWDCRTPVYTITFSSSDNEYGQVSTNTVSAIMGSTISRSDNDIYIDTPNGRVTVTATPTQSTARYTYSFTGWSLSSIPVSPSTSAITGDMSITANFTRNVNMYEITISSDSYGTVSPNQIYAEYDTPISVSDNTLTIGTYSIVATPNQPDAQYTYSFVEWIDIPSSNTVTGTLEISAHFSANINYYTVNIESNNTSYGTVDTNSVSVPYGTVPYTVENILHIGEYTVTATPTPSTPGVAYWLDSWSNLGTITEDRTASPITAVFDTGVREYFVSFSVNNPLYGSVSNSTVNVPYGTSILTSDNTITFGTVVVTATPTQSTAQYTYSFDEWVTSSDTVTQDMNITANFSRSLNRYTVTFTMDSGSGSWTYLTIEADYGSTISWSNNVVLVNGVSNTFTTSAVSDTESYSFKGLTGIPTDGIIVGDITVYAETDTTYSIPAIFIIQPKVGDDNIVWSLFKLLPIIILVVIIMFGATAFFKSRDDE